MNREQITQGSLILDKLETIERALTSLTNTIGSAQSITLSSSFTAKFKDELIEWMNEMKNKLEKELEQL